MSEQHDELYDLIARCGMRDQRALNKLYQRVSGYLNSVAYRIVKNEEWSNDVLQEAFIQIWENAGSYRPQVAKPLTWMTSIVRYRALDRLAKEQRHQKRMASHDDDSDPLENIAGGIMPEQALANHQGSQQLLDCMERLSDTMKTSVQLAYLEGYSREEIAERLNSKANTVKSWLRRAAEKLKQCLESL